MKFMTYNPYWDENYQITVERIGSDNPEKDLKEFIDKSRFHIWINNIAQNTKQEPCRKERYIAIHLYEANNIIKDYPLVPNCIGYMWVTKDEYVAKYLGCRKSIVKEGMRKEIECINAIRRNEIYRITYKSETSTNFIESIFYGLEQVEDFLVDQMNCKVTLEDLTDEQHI